jgi:DHA1 family tetracycline resistance protein-like MFS transporter
MSQKAGALFIFITIMLDTIGLGVVIPVLPDLLRRHVQSESDVSAYFGYFISLFALMQFLASPVLGKLSDKLGRKPILLFSLLFSAAGYLMMAYAPNLTVLFLSRIVSGIAGASFSVATAYVVDVSNDENRAKNFGMIGAAFGLGFILGPAIGGLLGSTHQDYPFLVAAAFTGLNFIYGWFVLPESLAPEKRRHDFALKDLNAFASVLAILKTRGIRTLVWVYLLFNMAGMVHPSCWSLFTRKKFDWSPAQIGISLTIVGIMSAISQGWLTRVFIPKLGEWKAATIGAWGQALSFFLFSISMSGTMLYGVLVLSSLFWIGQPALQSIISKSASPEKQGELQGSLNGLASLTAVVSPLFATSLFSKFSESQEHPFVGAPYVYGSFCFLLSAFLITNRSRKISE